MRNNTYLKLEDVYKKYRGYVTTKELIRQGFSNRQISVLAEEGYLEKICHGHYWLAGGQRKKPLNYKCIEVCLSSPRAVICMESAIYYQGGGVEETSYVSVATERTDRSRIDTNFPVKRHYFSSNNFRLGIRKVDTEFGSYNIYDVERSICDIVRFDRELPIIEWTDCVRNDERQRERLQKYAEILRVKQKF